MKTLDCVKRIVFVILCCALTFLAVSCNDDKPSDDSCKVHTDKDSDSKCDNCGVTMKAPEPDEPTDGDIELIKDGVANFQIVISSSLDSEVRTELIKLVSVLKDAGLDVKYVSESENKKMDNEILVGNVSSRGEKYEIDPHTLGYEGYMVKVIGTKVVVLSGGSTDAMLDAIKDLEKEILNVSKNKIPENLTISEKDSIINVYDKYRITSIKIAGVDLAEYEIATDKKSGDYYAAAEYLQEAFYRKAGYWIPIIELDELEDTAENVIVINHADDAGSEGFRVVVRDKSMFVECKYDNKFYETFESFVAQKVSVAMGEVNFSEGNCFKKDISKVYYKDFGAKGDGYTNDYQAIKAAHEFANISGQTVVANSGTYLIAETGGKATTIRTNVDWTKAEFIIDDSDITMDMSDCKSGIFKVLSDHSSTTIRASSDSAGGEAIRKINAAAKDGIAIARETTPVIDLGLGYKAMLVIFNENHKNYIRQGANQNSGSSQREVILVDEKGQVDPSTPFLHDYAEITYITVYRIDDLPLTLKGGKFTTIANSEKPFNYFSYSRGITINRSNTTVTGIEHYVEGEGETGTAYGAFISASNCNNIHIYDSIFTAHRTYDCWGSGNATVAMGTYDLGANTANNVVWEKCIQSNFFHLDEKGNPTTLLSMSKNSEGVYYWGIMGSNYCKNLAYIDSELTRFDAHCGVYNAKVIRSKVTALSLIGGGTFELIDSDIHVTGGSLFSLRADYGSTFNGDVIIDGVTMHTTSKNPTLLSASWLNHYYGYTTFLPDSITIKDFKIVGSNAKDIYVISEKFANGQDVSVETFANGEKNINPMVTIREVKILNDSGYTFLLPSSPFFNKTQITKGEE